MFPESDSSRHLRRPCTLHQDTTLYCGCWDVDEAYRQLRAKGLKVKEPRLAPYGMKQLKVAGHAFPAQLGIEQAETPIEIQKPIHEG